MRALLSYARELDRHTDLVKALLEGRSGVPASQVPDTLERAFLRLGAKLDKVQKEMREHVGQ